MKEDIDKIIAAVLSGQATDHERAKLSKWLREDKNEMVYEDLKHFWKSDLPEKQLITAEEKKDSIWQKATGTSINRVDVKWLIKVAAVVLIFLSTSIFFMYEYVVMEQGEVPVASQPIVKSNPPGVKSLITLPDGTSVNLNAGSSITFYDEYGRTDREVYLEGEAFFNVKHNPDKPFEVVSGEVTTLALGTSFNVNAYRKENIQVSLEEGKVGVQFKSMNKEEKNQLVLNPGEYCLLTSENEIEQGTFERDKVLGWKDGILMLEKADFNTVIDRLEIWYGVTFQYSELPKDWRFNGKFRNESLENVLESLSHSEQFDYEINNKTVKLSL